MSRDLLPWRSGRRHSVPTPPVGADPLTGLAGRQLLLDRLRCAQASCQQHGAGGALLFADWDHFKSVNDLFGHSRGDLLLQEIARRLNHTLCHNDSVARLDGDAFAIVLPGLAPNPLAAAAEATAVAQKLMLALGRPYPIAGQDYRGTLSIGITLLGSTGDTVDDLMKQAEIALDSAKSLGRNSIQVFDRQLRDRVKTRSALLDDLRLALSRQQFHLLYQPQVEAGRVVAVEALIRWQHPEQGVIAPAQFIPLAEETGLILAIGQWVLQRACAQLADWADDPATAGLTVAVNVSAQQLFHPGFADDVLAIIAASGADPARLKLELTESMLLCNMEDAIAKMTVLMARGVRFSLDDFGTGYSSLAYLKRLPLSQLKIDRSFVKDLLTDPHDAVIARSIIALGQSLDLLVVAEGVETAAQQQCLSRLGCSVYQGYLFGRPMPPEHVASMLRQPAPPCEEVAASSSTEKPQSTLACEMVF